MLKFEARTQFKSKSSQLQLGFFSAVSRAKWLNNLAACLSQQPPLIQREGFLGGFKMEVR
jgi:hypothetical protein